MSKSYAKNYEMKPNHLYFSYETGRIVLYLESGDNSLVLMQNEHNVFVNVNKDEYKQYVYDELGVVEPDFVVNQLKILDTIYDTINHIKKTYIISQMAKILDDNAPDLEVTVGNNTGLPKSIVINIYNTMRDMIDNSLDFPFKLIRTNETDQGIDFKVIHDKEKEKIIRESEEYKKFEQHMKSNKPDVEDMIDFILDTVIDGLKHGKKSKDDSDMVI